MDRRRFLVSGASAVAAAVLGGACRPGGRSGAASGRSPGSTGPASSSTPTTVSGPAGAGLDPTAAPVHGPARFVQHGPADTQAIALTFHGSGDAALTRGLLDITRRL